jgi:hypothetical protein
MESGRETPPSRTHNEEFQKRSFDLRLMVDHMKGRADLAKGIATEEVIPEQARDMAIKALSNELTENLSFFFHYLVNFINLGMQGLHHVDFEAGFTLLGDGIIQTDCCRLHIDDEILEIPVEIGTRYIQTVFGSPEMQDPGFIEQYYKNEESYYDRALGELSGRCELRVVKELFPKHSIHVVLKLPAQTLIENRISME